MELIKISNKSIDSVHEHALSAVFCVRNEYFRLPYFLDYYRNLGVDVFFAVDNGSTDETQKYLLEQPDVHLFYTDQEYKNSNAGRDWTYELASQYCLGKWCLTLDVDEFLVYPNCEHLDLHGLTAYMDSQGYQGLFSIFLDFYSDSQLSQVVYEAGSSPFEVCRFYDSPQNYTCYERDVFPYIEIKGGPRRRIFWPGTENKIGPSMRKLVLIKWDENFQYTHSTHSCVPIKLADLTGAVAHFKFMSHFAEYAKKEVSRNGRIANSIDWKTYASVLDNSDVCFYHPSCSLEFEDSVKLVSENLIRTSEKFEHYCHDAHSSNSKLPRTLLNSNSGYDPETHLGEIIKIWPAFSSISDHLGSSDINSVVIKRFEKDVHTAANSRIWRASYPFRKLASRLGLTDHRSLTEETFYNQSLHAKFVFTYKSIWWDILAPARIIQKIALRFKRKSN